MSEILKIATPEGDIPVQDVELKSEWDALEPEDRLMKLETTILGEQE